CSAGISYTHADQAVNVRRGVSMHDGRVQHDAAYFSPDGSTDLTPVQVKTSMTAVTGPAFRFTLQGYDWASQAEVDTVCLGQASAGGVTGPGCTDHGAA